MPTPSYHITDADSQDFGAATGYTQDGPGTLVMDADAFLVAGGDAMDLFDGSWTVTINGVLTSENGFGFGTFGHVTGATFPGTSITIGATAEISGYDGVAFSGGDLTNKGQIIAIGSDGLAVSEIGASTIKNSGTISSGEFGLSFGGPFDSGTHIIVNSGIIQAPLVIEDGGGGDTPEHVTNSGLMDGTVDLGGGNDTFTDSGKVKVGGKSVTHQGTVTGLIDLGSGNDHFTGGNNAETVEDGRGADVYKLGGGNDTFIATGGNGGDGVDTVDGGAGIDLYDASAATGAVAVNLDTKVHNGSAAGTAVVNDTPDKISNFENANGGAGADIIYGNAAANHIEGGGNGGDQLFGLGGNDILHANGNSSLFGGDGNDVLSVDVGGSFIDGGAGADIMTGGDFEGAGQITHIYKYDALTDSGITASTRDEITNFHASGDTIDLSAIDAIPSTSDHDDFHFIGESDWDGEAGALRYVWTETQTIVEADVNGDRKADFSIALDGHVNLTADDFAGVVTGADAPGTTAPSGNHITDANSGIYGSTPYHQTGPGTLTMDADAWLISAASTIVLDDQWTATINGKVISSDFSGSGGNAAIDLETATPSLHSSLTFGATAEIDGFFWGVLAQHATDITNKGNIDSASSSGFGIREGDGTYTINNSGSIVSGNVGIDFTLSMGGGSGTQTIINSGTITAPEAIAGLDTLKLTNSGTINGDIGMFGGTVTNSGTIDGDVSFLGDAVFNDFGKVKVGGKTVTHEGTVTGIISFGGAGNDHFNGGSNAETVEDGRGADVYKLAGGDDTFIASAFSTGNGSNTVDGGSGRDTYDFSNTGTAFTVNLDTKAHNGVAADSATFISDINGANTDKITNFEDVAGGDQNDIIYGSAAANHLSGGDGNDQLFGLAGNDVLAGGGGNDTLVGGAGRDIMTGDLFSESGGQIFSDTFVYTALSDSGITASTRDEITDFSQGTFRDVIDLSAIDANTKLSGHQEFHFIGESQWDGQAGALRYVFTATQTIIEADVNGDKKMDFSIALDGHHVLTAADFLGVGF